MLPVAPASYPRNVTEVLIATDSVALFDEVRSAVEEPGMVLRWARSGRAVLPALQERAADLVISDLQIGSMGGFAIGMQLGIEVGAGRLGPVPLLLLLDRRPDTFMAKRIGADGWLIKPLDPLRTAAAARALLAGDHYFDGPLAAVRADFSPT
jgi:DNA-binding response OmpR family regulator